MQSKAMQSKAKEGEQCKAMATHKFIYDFA
jgi:hypothetical protein